MSDAASAQSDYQSNDAAIAGFVCGLVGVLFPLVAMFGILLSAQGLHKCKTQNGKHRGFAAWGLGLSIIFTLGYFGSKLSGA